jgi:CheY-like chemotaxis protein
MVAEQFSFGDFGQLRGRETFPTISTLEGAILVIDDEPAIRDAMMDMLGFLTTVPIHGAENGYEGLQFFQTKKQNIVLVFLDMNMPVMNGEETYAHLRKIAPEVKVIISSSLSLEESRQRLGANEPHAFLQKPFTIASLFQTIMMLFALS